MPYGPRAYYELWGKGLMSQQYVADPSAFGRANYIKLLEGYRAA